jgi:hypothetical protein
MTWKRKNAFAALAIPARYALEGHTVSILVGVIDLSTRKLPTSRAYLLFPLEL